MGKAKTIINQFGELAGWNKIEVTIMGRVVEGIIQLSYGDSVEKENVYGKGSMPVGRGQGNYSAKCSITLYKEETIALQQAIGPGKRIQDIKPFDITVHYDYGSILYKDRIRNCEFTNNEVDVKQNDKTIGTKFDLIVSHIEPNVI